MITKVIEKSKDVRVCLVTLTQDSFVTWAVRHPDIMDVRLTCTTQPDEATARGFYEQLVKHLRNQIK